MNITIGKRYAHKIYPGFALTIIGIVAGQVVHRSQKNAETLKYVRWIRI